MTEESKTPQIVAELTNNKSSIERPTNEQLWANPKLIHASKRTVRGSGTPAIYTVSGVNKNKVQPK